MIVNRKKFKQYLYLDKKHLTLRRQTGCIILWHKLGSYDDMILVFLV